ncbi:MAG: LemA family protein [Gemmatimonadaceae bacterium]|nr:LemA family protein [Gemmatimonadaceae bacterium]
MGTILILMGVAAVIWAAISFNRLVRLRNQVRTAWADIDVQLKRRHDLVPQLVAAVKGYAGHERGVLTAVTELRAQAVAITSPAKLGETEAALEQALTQLFALKEAYPDLKANESFLQLQRDLVEVEDNLQYARRFYNGAVRDFNTAIQRFPDMLVAHAAGFTESEFFHADDEDRAVVKVELPS